MITQYSRVWRAALLAAALGALAGCSQSEPKDDAPLSSIKANDPHPAGNIGNLGDPGRPASQAPSQGK